MKKRLFDHREHGYSQSGEQGIILRIMDVLGVEHGLCCEFGAWDDLRALRAKFFSGARQRRVPSNY